MAARRASVDLVGTSTMAEIARRLSAALVGRVPGSWLRGFGYDAHRLPGSLSPTREQLDLVSRRHPIVLHERSGHEVVCNSHALWLLGGQDQASGRSLPGSGQLHDTDPMLDSVPRLDPRAMHIAMGEVSRALAAAGVTSVIDAGARNGPSEIMLLGRLCAGGAIVQRVEAMLGVKGLTAARALGWRHGEEVHGIRLGHVKLIGESHSPAELAAIVAKAHRDGWPVAVHVLDVGALDATLAALRASSPPSGSRDRIEHLALSLPEQLDELAALDVAVVTQPSFRVERAAKYRQELTAVERAWLYRIRSLLDRGILVAASSDAPVVESQPLQTIRAAQTRGLGGSGGHEEAVKDADALALVTSAAKRVGARPGQAGAGDWVVLDGDPLRLDGDPPRVLATFLDGRAIFEAPDDGQKPAR